VGRRLGFVAWLLIPLLGIVLAGWVTGGKLGGVSGWVVDGAGADTHWNMSVVDLPGAAVEEVHCNGKMRYDVELGETGPAHNPCERLAPGSRSLSIAYVVDVAGGGGLYRYSINGGPWIYYVGNRSWSWPPGIQAPPG
jgi:hypothetical protein